MCDKSVFFHIHKQCVTLTVTPENVFEHSIIHAFFVAQNCQLPHYQREVASGLPGLLRHSRI